MADIRLTLRIPEQLHATVKENSQKSDRSLNEEIVQALTNFYNVESEQNRRIAELERMVKNMRNDNRVLR
jgi:hypothetical protein